MHETDARLDAALNTYPIEPLPHGFSRRVMATINRKRVTYKLDFMDLALPLFLATFASITLVTFLLGVMMLDSVKQVQLQRTVEFLVSRLPDASSFYIFLFPIAGLVLCGAGLLLALTVYFNNPLRRQF
jgi:hypothetical protein